jgi:hypothetical protein
MTLRQFAEPPPAIPAATTWYLADLAQAPGKQELFTKQSPQKLKVPERRETLLHYGAGQWRPHHEVLR